MQAVASYFKRFIDTVTPSRKASDRPQEKRKKKLGRENSHQKDEGGDKNKNDDVESERVPIEDDEDEYPDVFDNDDEYVYRNNDIDSRQQGEHLKILSHRFSSSTSPDGADCCGVSWREDGEGICVQVPTYRKVSIVSVTPSEISDLGIVDEDMFDDCSRKVSLVSIVSSDQEFPFVDALSGELNASCASDAVTGETSLSVCPNETALVASCQALPETSDNTLSYGEATLVKKEEIKSLKDCTESFETDNGLTRKEEEDKRHSSSRTTTPVPLAQPKNITSTTQEDNSSVKTCTNPLDTTSDQTTPETLICGNKEDTLELPQNDKHISQSTDPDSHAQRDLSPNSETTDVRDTRPVSPSLTSNRNTGTQNATVTAATKLPSADHTDTIPLSYSLKEEAHVDSDQSQPITHVSTQKPSQKHSLDNDKQSFDDKNISSENSKNSDVSLADPSSTPDTLQTSCSESVLTQQGANSSHDTSTPTSEPQTTSANTSSLTDNSKTIPDTNSTPSEPSPVEPFPQNQTKTLNTSEDQTGPTHDAAVSDTNNHQSADTSISDILPKVPSDLHDKDNDGSAVDESPEQSSNTSSCPNVSIKLPLHMTAEFSSSVDEPDDMDATVIETLIFHNSKERAMSSANCSDKSEENTASAPCEGEKPTSTDKGTGSQSSVEKGNEENANTKEDTPNELSNEEEVSSQDITTLNALMTDAVVHALAARRRQPLVPVDPNTQAEIDVTLTEDPVSQYYTFAIPVSHKGDKTVASNTNHEANDAASLDTGEEDDEDDDDDSSYDSSDDSSDEEFINLIKNARFKVLPVIYEDDDEHHHDSHLNSEGEEEDAEFEDALDGNGSDMSFSKTYDLFKDYLITKLQGRVIDMGFAKEEACPAHSEEEVSDVTYKSVTPMPGNGVSKACSFRYKAVSENQMKLLQLCSMLGLSGDYCSRVTTTHLQEFAKVKCAELGFYKGKNLTPEAGRILTTSALYNVVCVLEQVENLGLECCA